MVAFLTQLLFALRSGFTRRARLEAENLLLRQQLIVLRRRHPGRVRLWNLDRLLMVWLYRLYPALLDAILIVQPETVIRWHRPGFRAYWRWRSRHVGGRPQIEAKMRALIRRLNRDRRANSSWVRNATIDRFITIRRPTRHSGYGFREAQPSEPHPEPVPKREAWVHPITPDLGQCCTGGYID